MEKRRGVEATAWLSFQLLQHEGWSEAEALATDICALLSLAAGNHVDWIIAKGFDYRGRWVASRHRTGITRPYRPSPLLNSTAVDYLRRLLESGIPALRRWNCQLGRSPADRPLHNAIRLFLDTGSEGIFLQSRTVVVVALVEFLAGKLGKSASLHENLVTSVRAAGLAKNEMPIDKFKKIRNKVVHTGDYSRRLGIPPVTQHFLMQEFAACLLLGLLGYEGKYYSVLQDWQEVDLPRA